VVRAKGRRTSAGEFSPRGTVTVIEGASTAELATARRLAEGSWRAAYGFEA